VAVIGDSITEQRQYSVFMEDYLLMCQPAAGVRATQFGWSGETSWGFLARMDNALPPFSPTAATTCYGMNDGGYSPMTEDKAKKYRDAQTAIVKKMKAGGVRFIVVGSPGAVDTDFFRRDRADPKKAAEMSAMYNRTLGQIRDIAREVAREQGVAFADVHDAMIRAMPKAKAKYGNGYHVCGGDGFHPDANGHLLMAYAFLKALGCDGDIGTITLDLASGKAEATDGHKVLSAGGGEVEVESTRYPFCFYGDPKSPSSTRGIAEFVPFNEDLNRFRLVVKGGPGDSRLKVTWGDASKEFTAADLANGINLAAAFADGNPFSEPFKAVEGEVRKKQAFETPLTKDLLQNLGKYKAILPEEAESLDRVAAAAVKKDKAMGDATAAAVKPVRHTIKVEPVK
jgi:lysophospholipase L1-like esterase